MQQVEQSPRLENVEGVYNFELLQQRLFDLDQMIAEAHRLKDFNKENGLKLKRTEVEMELAMLDPHVSIETKDEVMQSWSNFLENQWNKNHAD